ncbi:MAG: MoaD/ThiS family protein [Gemmatimonadetes bacterium]|nr:MoaD/ThiS family protein [Gemmatimonadota bacterium]
MSASATVLLFAAYADALGTSQLTMPVGDGTTVRDLLAALAQRPGADRLPPSPLVAVNRRYASVGDLVRSGDEVAVIPPVAGG